MTDTHHCVPCGLAEPRRPAYFDGKLLLARDFEDEQGYHVYKRQLLNSTLHGTGTVCGLMVHSHPAANCRNSFVVLEPGLALDCCGQEIIVPQAVAVPVADLIADVPGLGEQLTGDASLVIALKRCDRPGEFAPVILADCEGAASGGKPGRIVEGFDFHVYAATNEALAPATHAHTPKLAWEQTLTFAGAEPVAIAVDEDAQHAYVAVQFPPEAVGPESGEPASEGASEEAASVVGASRIFIYERRNHDLVSALAGPAFPIDMAVSPTGDQVYVAYAGSGEDGPGIAVYRKSDIRIRAERIGTIRLESPSRIAVSPRTGALLAFDVTEGVVTGWSQEAINEWAAAPDDATPPQNPFTVELEDWAERPIADMRGAVFAVAPNGRFAFVVDGKTRPVRLIDLAAAVERAKPLEGIDTERAVAAAWSFDSDYLFILSASEDEDGPTALLRRFGFKETESTLTLRGRGVGVHARAVDLAVSPGERWAYALVARSGVAGEETLVLALDGGVVTAAGETIDFERAIGAEVALPGTGRQERLTFLGRQLYVACADEDLAAQPARGLVAVIEPDEADCGERFRTAIEGCPACAAGGVHSVVLATLPGYVAAKAPAIVDGDPQGNEVAIDNITYRPLVPSAVTLKDVIDCILAEGIAEGPPGPRGDSGARGPGITEVSATALPAGSEPTIGLEPIPGDTEGDFALVLGIPAGQPGADGANGSNGTNGAPGQQGPRGPGITEVTATTLPANAAATAQLIALPNDSEGDFRLTLGIPRGADGSAPPPPDIGRITALSWKHGATLLSTDLVKLIAQTGLIVGFDREVSIRSLVQLATTGLIGFGTSFVFEVLARDGNREGPFRCICPLEATCEGMKNVELKDGLLIGGEPAQKDDLVRFVRLRVPNFSDKLDLSLIRIVLRCDFVVDKDGRAIDGNFIGGNLPTGNGIAGGLFESWLSQDPGKI